MITTIITKATETMAITITTIMATTITTMITTTKDGVTKVMVDMEIMVVGIFVILLRSGGVMLEILSVSSYE